MADKTPVTSELSRDLSLFHITMMGLGMMIGAGVFIGIGNTIHIVGPGGVLLTFALNGLIALFTAMSFAELSSAIPRAGGVYNFARIAFGRGPSFLAGWMEWFASSVAGSLYAVVFATYTLDFLQQMGLLGWLGVSISTAQKVVAVSVACFFIYVNYRGASETGRVGAFFTIGQMIFVAAIAVAGIIAAILDPSRVENFRPFLPHGWGKLMVTMGFIYVAFEGFEVIAQAGDEAINPKRNIPKAMIYSVFIVTISYIAVSFATVVAAKSGAEYAELLKLIGQSPDTGFGRAVARLMPSAFVGYLLVTLAVIFSSTSALNATIYSATRASFAMGRDRMLPAFLANISRKRRTPHVALIFTAVIVMVVVVMLPTRDVASSASIMFLFLFFLVNICVIKIRYNMGDELSYGFVMPLFPLLPILALICQAILAAHLVHMSRIACVIAPAWILGGVGIYMLYSRSHAIATEHDVLVFEEQKAPPTDGYRIMVAVANPDNALQLVRNTYKLCVAKNASVELLHMVPVPDQMPLADAGKYMLAGKEGIVETMLYLEPEFPISTTIRYCRNIARGIISAVREKKTDMLIMGWHGQTGPRAFNLGSTVDPVIERSPCHIMMLKDCGGNREFKRVLVPVAGGPNSALALEVASILVEPNEGSIVAFTVEGRRKDFDIDQFVNRQQDRLCIPRHRVKTKTVHATRVVDAIITEAENYELVVMGCTRRSLLHQVAHQTTPQTIARLCEKPFVMVNAPVGIGSWIRKWL